MNKLIYIFLIIVTAQFVFSKPRNDNPNNARNNSTIILDNNTPNSTSAFVKLQTRFDPNRVDSWFIDTEIPIFKGENRDYIEKLI